MKTNPDLKPDANKKGGVNVTLTLKPETVEFLKATGSMGKTVDKIVELVKQICGLRDGLLRALPSPETFVRLAPRELEVLKLMAEGKEDPEIAATLCLSVNTVKSHGRSFRHKLAVTNRAQAVEVARKMGLI
jgi:DNA-binding NarL/FixJ family response regulator